MTKAVPQNAKIFSIVMLAFITIGGIVLLLVFDMDDVLDFIYAHSNWVVVISLFVYALLGFTIIPATPLTIALTVILGPLPAILWGTVGMVLASLVEYFVGRQICDVLDIEIWRSKLPERWRNIPLDSIVFHIFGRFFPGPKVISIAGATLRMSMLRYIWTSLVSNLIGTSLVVLISLGILKLPL